jgi:hypothetical protein
LRKVRDVKEVYGAPVAFFRPRGDPGYISLGDVLVDDDADGGRTDGHDAYDATGDHVHNPQGNGVSPAQVQPPQGSPEDHGGRVGVGVGGGGGGGVGRGGSGGGGGGGGAGGQRTPTDTGDAESIATALVRG